MNCGGIFPATAANRRWLDAAVAADRAEVELADLANDVRRAAAAAHARGDAAALTAALTKLDAKLPSTRKKK